MNEGEIPLARVVEPRVVAATSASALLHGAVVVLAALFGAAAQADGALVEGQGAVTRYLAVLAGDPRAGDARATTADAPPWLEPAVESAGADAPRRAAATHRAALDGDARGERVAGAPGAFGMLGLLAALGVPGRVGPPCGWHERAARDGGDTAAVERMFFGAPGTHDATTTTPFTPFALVLHAPHAELPPARRWRVLVFPDAATNPPAPHVADAPPPPPPPAPPPPRPRSPCG